MQGYFTALKLSEACLSWRFVASPVISLDSGVKTAANFLLLG